MMNDSIYLEFIIEKLNLHTSNIESQASLNLLDLNVRSEIFYRDFFNLLFGWSLEKTKHHNEPGIDLVDIKNNIVVSVSGTATMQKIDSSLNKLGSNYSGYAFKFISISKDASNLKNKQNYSNPHGLIFSPSEDIYDVQALLKKIAVMEIEPLRAVYEFMRKWFDKDIDPESLKSIERLKNYLHDNNNWKHGIGEEQNSIFHYEKFPEFTIVENDNFEEYIEPWVFRFPDKHSSSRLEYFAKYHTTILDKIHLVCCDGGRFVTAEPRMWFKHSPQTYHYIYYFIKDSIEYLVAQMVTTVEHHNICREQSIYKEFEIFESEEDASRLIEADFAAGMHQYIYYSFDEKTQRYSRIEKGVSSPINQ